MLYDLESHAKDGRCGLSRNEYIRRYVGKLVEKQTLSTLDFRVKGVSWFRNRWQTLVYLLSTGPPPSSRTNTKEKVMNSRIFSIIHIKSIKVNAFLKLFVLLFNFLLGMKYSGTACISVILFPRSRHL